MVTSPKNKYKYQCVSLPNELMDEVQEVVNQRYKGFRTRAEFVKAAIRYYLAIQKKEVMRNERRIRRKRTVFRT